MYLLPYLLFNVLILNTINFAFCDLNEKSSLTFVIDATASMHDDIDQVKENVNQVFDVVLTSNTTQIENFVIIVFRDPDVHVITETSDTDKFRVDLASIRLIGNYDCPEYSMSGIEKGIEISKPGSLMYVFTDASSRDYEKYETVRQMAIRKGIQIVFLLSSHCTWDIELGSEQVYYDLARETKGKVFDVEKREIGKFMKYVKEIVSGRKNVIYTQNFSAGKHQATYKVDANMKEMLISISGKDPEADIYDPSGAQSEAEEILRTQTAIILKVNEVTPGVYRADVKSKGPMTVDVAVTDTLSFKCGFSLLEPSSIDETVPEPLPNQNSFMAIKLEAASPVQLRQVQIMDLNHNVIENLHLLPYDYKKQFYITDSFKSPTKDFYIAITGWDTKSNTLITRYSLTPVRQQQVITATVNKAPEVKIIGETSLKADYGEPLQLKCKVSGYPKPSVQWRDGDEHIFPQTELIQVRIPYEHLSVFKIDKVNRNNSYTCEATNSQGSHKQTVNVLTIRNKYFDVLETPKDTTVKHNTKAIFHCKINALPEAKIKWVRIMPGDIERIKSNKYFAISESGSKMTIKKMAPHLVGRYRCLAENSDNRKNFMFRISTDGFENPKIERLPNNFQAVEGNEVVMKCRILNGKPIPSVHWYYYREIENGKKTPELVAEGETFKIKSVNKHHAGSYMCVAFNDGGEDTRLYTLGVEYPPIIERNRITKLIAHVNKKVKLPCSVQGFPDPEVSWYRNGEKIHRSSTYHILSDHTLKFKSNFNKNGTYTCEATNRHGKDSITINLHIFVGVEIDPAVKNNRTVLVGSSETLTCVVSGKPKPIQRWSFIAHGSKNRTLIQNFNTVTGSLELSNIQLAQSGTYYCRAMNIGSQAQIIYNIEVESPPSIKIKNSNTIHAVENDTSLILSCAATGNPEPQVGWKKDGEIISKETEYYRILDDSSLEIKTVISSARSVYYCEAKNKYGVDRAHFQVSVDKSPVVPTEVKQHETYEEGKPASIPCSLSYDPRTDSLRWYKDGKYLTSGPIDFDTIKSTDEGVYTCRVSRGGTSKSAHVKVNVGAKPSFVNHAELEIQFREGAVVEMDCEVTGSPAPEVHWWHSHSPISESTQQHSFVMTNINRGIYICLASNTFGSIYRKFEITTKECVLNVTSDFGLNHPLLVDNKSINMPRYENIDGLIRIPSKENIHLICPSGFTHPTIKGETKIMAKCVNTDSFEIKGEYLLYSDLRCHENLKPTLKTTGESCLRDSKKLNIGYEADGEFFGVYEICHNDSFNITLYVKHTMYHSLAYIDTKPSWSSSNDPKEMYDCDKQVSEISSILGTDFHTIDKCCFSEMQLVGTADVAPGAPQLTTFSDVNLIPHWSTCNTQNWKSLEKKVRKLAASLDHDLIVWTGISGQLEMQSLSGENINIFISDKHGRRLPVPMFIWKVIQDSVTKAAIAVVQVNVPDFSITDAYKYLRCNDICSDVSWLKSHTWRNPDRGFTYCCELNAFVTGFNLQDDFYGVASSGNILN